MSEISYIRAGISCIPFIGPLMGFINIKDLSAEVATNQFIAAFKALRPMPLGEDEAKILAEANPAPKDEANSIPKKGKIYSICGIIGNVLTIATMITLLALGIIGSGVIMGTAICIGLTCAHAYHLYQYNKLLNKSNLTTSS